MSALVGAQHRPSLRGPRLLLAWTGEGAGMMDKVSPLSRPQRGLLSSGQKGLLRGPSRAVCGQKWFLCDRPTSLGTSMAPGDELRAMHSPWLNRKTHFSDQTFSFLHFKGHTTFAVITKYWPHFLWLVFYVTLCSSHLLFSGSVVSDSLWPHGLPHARPPCPSPSPRACLNSCPLSQ